MKRIIAYLCLFMMFTVLFRVTVLRRNDDPNFAEYMSLVDNIDNSFDDLVQTWSNYASRWNNSFIRAVENTKLPDWLKGLLTWLFSAMSDLQEFAFYSVGLLRYPVTFVSVVFKFLFL